MEQLFNLLKNHFATDEVEITEDLIVELTTNLSWKREHLEEFRKQGYKYSKSRNTIVVSTEMF